MQALSNTVAMEKKSLKMKLRDRERKLSTKLLQKHYYYLVGEIVITVIAVKSGVLKQNK